MWIVRLALRRPYTVAVFAALILLLGALSLTRMQVDVFPRIDIPVVAVVWAYPGLPAEDMERRVVLISERAYSTTVNGIERIESQSVSGIGLMRIYFQPGADIGAAIAQISSVSSTILRILPPGMTPPNVIQFNASNVPVAQMTVYSNTLPEEQLFDYSLNFVRIRLFTIPGLSSPAPFGGRQRQIMIDVDPQALAARGLSTFDVVNALQASNVILPAGTARVGSIEYNVTLNASPSAVDQFRAIPVRVTDGVPVLLGDVARVVDGYADQTNVVRVNGRRATYLAILKHADASTLAVVDATRDALPQIQAAAPHGMQFRLDFDQSMFVRASVSNVVREGVIASLLVSLMILVFLGSWRSTLIVCTSIPLAIFTSILGLFLTNQSINVMTLGGLALAIGMLVDDATVEVENIHRNRGMGKPLTRAILDGAAQVAVPAIVATLSICIVFFPVALLVGPSKFLFIPLALAVVFAMLASYVLSRTLVPTLARMLLEHEHHPGSPEADARAAEGHRPGRFARLVERFNARRDRAFERFRGAYARVLALVLHRRAFVMIAAALLVAVTLVLGFHIGLDFFPPADAGLMRLHVRAPAGSRIESTEELVARVDERIRQVIPAHELLTINDMIGLPISYNLAFVRTENTASMDAEVLIELSREHRPTVEYQRVLRRVLPHDFPGATFYFEPADIVTQVLNFGLSAPIDVQVEGNDLERSFQIARRLRDDLRQIPGTQDVRITQVLVYPSLRVDVDRVRAAQVGVSQRDIANSMLTALSTSATYSPSYFLNPTNNVNYLVAVHVPLRRMDSVDALMSTSVAPAAPTATGGGPVAPTTSGGVTPSGSSGAEPATPLAALPSAPSIELHDVSSVRPIATSSRVDHYTVQRVVDVAASVEGRDLGSVVSDIEARVRALGRLPAGTRIHVRGQNEVMNASFKSLGLGLILSIVLVYLLIVVLFQSWLDPLIIMVAVPGALVGILWMLAITGTTINVESLMGAIMAVGIAVSNSILLVSFANDLRIEHGASAIDAALEAGRTRLRPVLMTALAMIIGMLPMALGLGEGGEQNAPLGRAVIGGLLVATLVTLFIVPVAYSLLRRAAPTKHRLEEKFRTEARGEAAEGGAT
jgi:multidrug efflux pump subunit AcrB